MTANELADRLDMVRIELTIQAATMLRQQQAEIEVLKLYKEKIETMERAYDNHFAQAMGNPKIKKASEK